MFRFPYGNLHGLNLDWLLNEWKKFRNSFEKAFTATVTKLPPTADPDVTVTYDDQTSTFNFDFELPEAAQPSPASALPLMDGIADAGTSMQYARADHVHPKFDIKNKRILFIGDSYNGVTSTKWTDVATGILGITDFEVLAQGGYSFAGSNKWLTLLQSQTFANEDTITDIVIVGGANDAWSTLANIPTEITSFNNYVRSRFTGLTDIWLGFAGNTYAGGNERRNMRDAMKYYIIGAKSNGWHYMHGIESSLFNPNYMQKIGSNDYIHPNATGVSIIGNNVAECLITGSCQNYNSSENIEFTKGIGTGTFNLTEAVNDNILFLSMGDVYFANTTALSGNVTIGTCPELKNMLTPYVFINVYVTIPGTSDNFSATITFTDYQTLVLMLPRTVNANAGITLHGFSQIFNMLT